MGAPPVQLPAWHVSFVVQALPSLHEVPSGLGAFTHSPVAGSQVPAWWQTSPPPHTTGVCSQAPSVHVSTVHGSLSSQALPLKVSVEDIASVAPCMSAPIVMPSVAETRSE